MSNWKEELEAQTKFGNSLPPEHRRISFQATKTVSANTRKLLPENSEAVEIGYMNFIRALQEKKQEIVVIKADGEVIRGFVKAADAETISLTCPIKDEKGRYRTRVLFKHQIAEFSPTKGIEDMIDELVSGGPLQKA